jgi:hypothetical protein
VGRMKEFDLRIRGGGDDAIQAISEYLEAQDKDLVARLRRWLESPSGEHDPGGLVQAAIEEIVSLRAMLTRERESASLSVRLMTENAYKAGYMEGGMEMILLGQDAKKVAKSCLKRFNQ